MYSKGSDEMMRKRAIAALALMSCAAGAGATEGPCLSEMEAMYEAGRPEAAYELGRSHLLEAEGDPAFDFYYGVAAIDSGFAGEGGFAGFTCRACR